MKKIVLLTLTALSFAANAQLNGSPTTHILDCNSGEMEGASYQLICQTQALAPQHSLRGCDLYVTAIIPNAVAQKIPLAIRVQSGKSASLVNVDEKIKVKFTKLTMSARVRFSHGAVLECREGGDGGGISAGN